MGRGREKRELFIGEGGRRYRVGRTKGSRGGGGETVMEHVYVPGPVLNAPGVQSS